MVKGRAASLIFLQILVALLFSYLSVSNAVAGEGPSLSQIQQFLDERGFNVKEQQEGLLFVRTPDARFFVEEIEPGVALHVIAFMDEQSNLATTNKWNAGSYFSKAYIDEDGDLALETTIFIFDATVLTVATGIFVFLNDMSDFLEDVSSTTTSQDSSGYLLQSDQEVERSMRALSDRRDKRRSYIKN